LAKVAADCSLCSDTASFYHDEVSQKELPSLNITQHGVSYIQLFSGFLAFGSTVGSYLPELQISEHIAGA